MSIVTHKIDTTVSIKQHLIDKTIAQSRTSDFFFRYFFKSGQAVFTNGSFSQNVFPPGSFYGFKERLIFFPFPLIKCAQHTYVCTNKPAESG